ncbi:hypothetical protein AIC90_004215 [Salmonella enterica subsp. enterica]|nr:hypothetical protein [Salmonella enterica subsp. enterica]MII25864.1 hypothetical protein [Salmonella enterica subsp. enterica]
MATLYPYEVYTLVVSELIVSHFNDVAMVYPGSEEIKKSYDSELSAVQVVNGIREILIEDGVIQCEQCPLLSEWDENKVINQLIKDYRLILNRDYELNRVRQQLAPELIALIENWKEQKYSDSAKEYEVLYETININGKEVTGKLNVVAVSSFDAVYIVGQRHANDNFLVLDVKEVMNH